MNIFPAIAMVTALVFGSPAIPTTDEVHIPVRTPLSSWLEKLAYCESRNNPEIINPTDGGSPSYGYLQFKIGTFVHYSRQYGLYPDTEDKEMMNLIMDKDAQLKLATEIIGRDYAWENWTNCTKNYVGLPPR